MTVGIALATYNPNQKFFRAQIESLRAQTYSKWICYLYDDCSEQESWLEIQAYLKDDPRFVIKRGTVNIGVFSAFEIALTMIPSEVSHIALCDQDDVWLPNKIENLLGHIQTSNSSLVHSDLLLINDQDDIISESCWAAEGRLVKHIQVRDLIFRNVVTGCSCLFTREVLDHSLPFPRIDRKRLPFYHDVWIALHAANEQGIKSISEPLVKYRQHGANVVGGGRRGVGISGNFLMRCRWQFKSRLQLIYAIPENDWRKTSLQKELLYLSAPHILFVRCIRYCLLSPKMFKTALMIFLGRMTTWNKG